MKTPKLKSLCRTIGSIKILKNLARPLVNDNLKTATKYYGYDPDEIAAMALGMPTILSIASFFLLMLYSSLAALACALTIGYFSFTYILNFFPEKLRAEQNVIAKYSGLILQEIYFVLRTTKSIFDAIDMISKAEYPIISEKFRKILLKTQNGDDPNRLILNFAESQPSDSFRRGIIEFVTSYDLTDEQAKEIIEISEDEARGYLKEFSYQLESRLLIFFGLSFFFPLVIAFTLALYGLALSPFVLFVIPIHLALTDGLSHRLIGSRIGVLG